jgi:hypothetical protein
VSGYCRDNRRPAGGEPGRSCGQGDRGRLLGSERVASYPTAADARAHFDSWVEFYQDFYQFPADLPVDIGYGFDTYKVTYCTVDVARPGTARPVPRVATGNVSVPRNAGRLSTVAYQHGTAVSFYDAPSNPNVFGEFEERGESFDGPPSSAIFAGAGFIYVAADYLGPGDSTVPRHRYFHAATEASSAVDLLEASDEVLSIANTSVVTVPLYVSYLLLAYDDIYDVYGRPADVFRQPYAATVPGLFDMRHFFDDVLAACRDLARAPQGLVLPGGAHQPGRPAAGPAAGERRRPLATRRAHPRLPQPRRRGGALRGGARVGGPAPGPAAPTSPSGRSRASTTSTAGSRRCRARCATSGAGDPPGPGDWTIGAQCS